MRVITSTRATADDLCAKIDADCGYPKVEQEIGPPVLTERWTSPIEMADGTFGVVVNPRIEARLGKEIATSKRAIDLDRSAIKVSVDALPMVEAP